MSVTLCIKAWLVKPEEDYSCWGQIDMVRKPLAGSEYDRDDFDIASRDAWFRVLKEKRHTIPYQYLEQFAKTMGWKVAYEVFVWGVVAGTNRRRHTLFPQVYYNDTEKHFFRKYGLPSVYAKMVLGSDRRSFE